MKENKAYDFFTQSSRLILFIPVALLAIMVLIRWGGWGGQERTPSQKMVSMSPTAITKQTTQSFNLTGPFACEGQLPSGTASALIRDHNILATVSAGMTATHVLINGDCAYFWESKAKTGTKRCGIGSFMSLADGLLSAGTISVDALAGARGTSSNMIKGVDLQALSKSCKKAVIPAQVFEMPRGVQFVEKTE